MTELSLHEIERLLTEQDIPQDPYGNGEIESYPIDWKMWKSEYDGEVIDVPGLGKAEMAAEYGGEGEGTKYWVVVKVTFPDGTERYFRKDGYYISYGGADLDGPMREVFPREETVTVFKDAKGR